MSKYAIISTDNNPDYYSLIPLVAHSWQKIGYIPVVIIVNVPMEVQRIIVGYCPAGVIFRSVAPVDGVKDSTVAQFARIMFACTMEDDDILVTGDGDMLVMKDIFTSDSEITSYGFDLTGRSELPICYIKATAAKWCELMKIKKSKTLTENIIGNIPQKAYSSVWEDYWSVDQQVLTHRAKEYGFDRITFIDRGFAGPIAANRWDRYCWDKKPDDIIDVHAIRGVGNWDKIADMANQLFPGDDMTWLADFRKEFNEML